MTQAPARFVLVVDDDEDLRILVARILRDSGFEVETAMDGAQAVERIEAHRPDLIILDLMMPNLDGWGVLAKLREQGQAPPVVVLTARDDYDSFARSVREGASAHVVKPFRFQELVATCHNVLAAASRQHGPAKERRRDPRRVLMVQIQVLSRERSPLAVGELVDVSLGGAQVHLDVSLDVGTQVRLAFQPPGGGGTLQLSGLIQWCEPARRGYAFGLSFTELTDDAQRRLRELLASV